jgi:hypothetical protein
VVELFHQDTGAAIRHIPKGGNDIGTASQMEGPLQSLYPFPGGVVAQARLTRAEYDQAEPLER